MACMLRFAPEPTKHLSFDAVLKRRDVRYFPARTRSGCAWGSILGMLGEHTGHYLIGGLLWFLRMLALRVDTFVHSVCARACMHCLSPGCTGGHTGHIGHKCMPNPPLPFGDLTSRAIAEYADILVACARMNANKWRVVYYTLYYIHCSCPRNPSP